jgi:tetratricopeptide (TPR) repeat protein
VTGWLTVVLIVAVFRLALLWFQSSTEKESADAMSAPDRWMIRLRDRIYARDWDAFEKLEAEAWDETDRLPRDLAFPLAVQLGCLRIEYGIWREVREHVLEGLATVRANARNMPFDARRRREAEALALATLALDPAAPDPQLVAIGEEALALADDVPWTQERRGMVHAAVRMSLVRRAMKDDAAADRAATLALELCGPRDLEDAYVAASTGALEASRHYLAAGDAEKAAGWFDRAERVVTGLDTEACRVRLAYLLLVRNVELPGDPVFDEPRRRQRNETALERLKGLESDEARLLGARAHANLAGHLGADGMHRVAVQHLEEALAMLSGLTSPGASRMRVEVRLTCGRAKLAAQDPGAGHDFQLALDEAAASEQPATREMAIAAATALHPLQAALGMHAGAAETLARAAEVAASFEGEAGRVARAQVELERARATHLAGRPVDARARLRALDGSLEGEEGPAFAPLRRAAAELLGYWAFAAGDSFEAADRFELALAMDWDATPASDAERAEIEWHLATVHAQLDRFREARQLYRQSFERGRASGLPDGRFAAAQSALQLAEHSDLSAERRAWLEAALALAKLVGTPGGEELAVRVGERLRELAGGAS